MQQPILLSERLRLRAFQQADAKRVSELAGNYEVAKTTASVPHPYTQDDAVQWISSHDEAKEAGVRFAFAVTCMDDDKVIGVVSLFDIENAEAEIGYWIGQPYWGNGFCTEAVRAVIEFGFESLGLTKIVGAHFAGNPASGRVLQKCGMSFKGRSTGEGRESEEVDLDWYELVRRL